MSVPTTELPPRINTLPSIAPVSLEERKPLSKKEIAADHPGMGRQPSPIDTFLAVDLKRSFAAAGQPFALAEQDHFAPQVAGDDVALRALDQRDGHVFERA